MAGISRGRLVNTRAVLVLLALGILVVGCQSGDPKNAPKTGSQPEKAPDAAKAPATPAPAPQPAAPAKADGKASLSPPGNPLPGEVMDKLGKDGTARASEEKAMAQHYYEVGKRLYDDLEYEKAYDTLERAVQLDPTHAKAVELFQSAGLIIGKRQDELKGQLKRFKDEFDVKVELTRQEMVRFYEAGEKKFNSSDFDGAIKDLERVKEMIAWYPYRIDVANYADKADKLIIEAKRKKRDADIQLQEEMEREALKRARDEQKQKVKSDARRLQTMLDQTLDLMRARRYQDARDLATRILEIEPTNPFAKKLREQATNALHLDADAGTHDRLEEEREADERNTDRAMIPQESRVIVFPTDWQERTAGRRAGIATDESREPFWQANMRKVLKERKVTLNFPDVPLKDVVLFLQEITGLNFVIGQGVDAEEKKVSLRLKDIVLENALKIIMEQTKLIYIFSNEAIIITEPGSAKGELIFEIYDISDITFKTPDFTARRITLPNPSAPGGGAAMGSSGSLIFDEKPEGGGELSGDALIEIVKQSTGGDESWGEGTSIEPHRGQLLVNNTRDVHARISEVLNNLRRNQGIFVHIETRFVDIENDSLEDVGVDFRGLGGNPGDERNRPNTSNPFGTPLDMNVDRNRRGGTDVGVDQRRNAPASPGRLNAAGQPIQFPGPNPEPGNKNTVWRTQNIFDGSGGIVKGNRLIGGGGLTLLVTALDPFQVNAIIRMEGQSSKVRRLTAPRVTAANRERVFVSVLTQRAYISSWELISGGTGLVVVEVPDPIIHTFQEGVVLEVRPTVSSDRKFVTLDVRPSLATLVGGTISTITVNLGSLNMAAFQVPIGVPKITLEEAFTSVTIPDGGTALLGGFRQINQHIDENSLPFVDNIPFLNVLFRRLGEVKETRSLVILITAKIISVRDEEARRYNRPK